MCIIISAFEGKEISEDVFRNSWNANPDGFGMAYARNGKIEIYKSLYLEEAYTEYKKRYKEIDKGAPYVAHFRIGTQAENDLTNAHPFMINKDLAFVHNGIISQYMNYSTGVFENFSDTRIFNTLVLQQLPKNFLSSKVTRKLLEDFLYTDKLAFLGLNEDGTPFVDYINKERGLIDDGFWYSNTTYKPYTKLSKFVSKRTAKSKTFYCDYCGEQEPLEEKVTVSFKGSEFNICVHCLADNGNDIAGMLEDFSGVDDYFCAGETVVSENNEMFLINYIDGEEMGVIDEFGDTKILATQYVNNHFTTA